MDKIKIGDCVGDCPSCGAEQSVIYRGDDEAVCNKCGSIYDVDIGDESQDDQQQKVEEAPVEIPVDEQPLEIKKLDIPETVVNEFDDKKQVKIDSDEVGKLVSVVDTSIAASKNRLSLGEVETLNSKARMEGVPAHMLKSRPWRWAHHLGNSGNPYRENCKSWVIFESLSKGNTIAGAIAEISEHQLFRGSINYLLTVYETAMCCVTCGLLEIDIATGIVKLCEEKPQLNTTLISKNSAK